MKNIFKILVPVGLISLLVWNIAGQWGKLSGYWQNLNITFLTLMFLVMLFIFPEAAFAWHVILKKLKTPRNLRRTIYIWITSNTGRYIPGIVWQYIGRVELGTAVAKIPRRVGAISVILEALFALFAALLVSFLTIPSFFLERLNNLFWIIPVIFISLFTFQPKILGRVLTLISWITKREIPKIEFKLNFSTVAVLIFLYGVNLMLNGFALFLLTQAFGVIDFDIKKLFLFSGFYSLSWILGYLTLVAPAGLGVTEVSLAFLLSSQVPLYLAAGIAVVYRFFLTIAEVAVFVFVTKMKK